MKLLVLSSTFPRKNHKFLGIFVKRQIDSFIGYGINVKVICPVRIFPPKSLMLHPFSKRKWAGWLRLIKSTTGKSDGAYYLAYSSPPYPWFRALGGFFFLMFNSRKIFSVASGADAVFSNFIFESGLVSLIISKKLSIPLYLSIHENIHKQYQKAFFWKYLAKYVLLNSDLVFVNSNSTKNIIYDFVPTIKDKIKLLPLGVQSEYFQNIVKTQNNNNIVKVVAISHFVKNKNLDIIIKSVVQCHNKFNIRLTIMGDGEEHDNLLKIVDDTKSDRYIKFIVHPTQSQIIEEFRKSSIIVQIAGHETFGLAVAEGIASGLIPVVSKSSGIVDDFNLLGGFMITIDQIIVEKVCDAIEYAANWLKNISNRDVLYKNQGIIKKNYDWDRSSGYVAHLHEKILLTKGK